MLMALPALTTVPSHEEHAQRRPALPVRGRDRSLMRLLDLVAQAREPLVILPRTPGGQPVRVRGPNDFARTIVECPLRFVIADDLTRASAELAFADGDRLANCLDLLRIPAPLLWVEWERRYTSGSSASAASCSNRIRMRPGGGLGCCCAHRRTDALQWREHFGPSGPLTANARRKCRPWRPASTSTDASARQSIRTRCSGILRQRDAWRRCRNCGPAAAGEISIRRSMVALLQRGDSGRP